MDSNPFPLDRAQKVIIKHVNYNLVFALYPEIPGGCGGIPTPQPILDKNSPTGIELNLLQKVTNLKSHTILDSGIIIKRNSIDIHIHTFCIHVVITTLNKLDCFAISVVFERT